MSCFRYRSPVAVLVLGGLTAGLLGGARPPVLKDVMKQAHDGPASLLGSVGKALKADEPDWADIQARTRRLVEVTAAIDRADPPLGDRASWEKLARAYLANVKALDEAAAKKDRPAAQTAKAKIDASCGVCHRAHRPPDR